MSRKKDDDPEGITPELCKAYRKALEEQIKGLKNTIVTSVSISTAVISIIILIVKFVGGI